MDYIIRHKSDKGEVAKAIYGLPESKKPWLVRIRLQNPTRSIDQNGYYWKIVIGLSAKAFGYTPKEMHIIWKDMMLAKEEIVGFSENRIEVMPSTTKLSTVEMEDYLSQIRIKSSEMGIYIPLPNEVMED